MTEGSIPKKRTTIYVDGNIHKAMRMICLREEVSLSVKTEQMWTRYIAAHSRGNPQLRLEPFIGSTTKVCFGCEGHFKTLKRVQFVSGLKAALCHDCFEDYDKRTVIKKVLGSA